jgi:microcystin degradation protein MlrC
MPGHIPVKPFMIPEGMTHESNQHKGPFPMRIAIASYGQETSSFSQLPTTLETFGLYGLYEGEEILEKCHAVGAIGGFMKATEDAGLDWTPVPIIHGWAGAHGPLTADTLAYFEEAVYNGLKNTGPLDALFFALHGAAVADNEHDTEGRMLAGIRRMVGPDLPIVISLDHHANLTQKMVDHTDGLVAHRTQPHDQFETGLLAGRMLISMLRGETKPVIAWRNIPLITHQEQFLTSHGPMKAWFDLAREIETRPGVLSASNFPMQPWLDVPEGGWSVAIVTDNDPALAQQLAAELADAAWNLREAYCKLDSISPEAAVCRAVEAEKGLVVLSDTGDSVWGGATGDSTCLLTEMLKQNIQHTALVPMVDPETVDLAIRAGIGAEIHVTIGGKLDAMFGRPLEVTAKVAGIGGGRFEVVVLGFESFDTGRTVLLEIGTVKVLVSEKRGIGGNHPVVYEQLGLDVDDAHMVVVKTASNWQYYQPWISEVIRVDTPGATMSHLEQFEWHHLPRPIYPLDELSAWQAE